MRIQGRQQICCRIQGFSPKSQVIPEQVKEHVGFVINSIQMLVSLPEDKVMKMKNLIVHCLDQDRLTIRQVAQLLGKLEATKDGNRFAQFFF